MTKRTALQDVELHSSYSARAREGVKLGIGATDNLRFVSAARRSNGKRAALTFARSSARTYLSWERRSGIRIDCLRNTPHSLRTECADSYCPPKYSRRPYCR